jgi:hypothetical protein
MVCWNYLGSETDYTENVDAPDFLAFSLIIFLANKSKAPGLKVPRILRTIAEDSTWYFLVIFTSTFVLLMTLTLGRVSAIVSLYPGHNQ